jgi:phosphoglycerate dehydrogenase-like enzyme
MIRLLYCGSGWLDVVPRIERAMTVPAEVRVRDRSRPIVEQLEDVDVVLPSNMHLGAEELAAGRRIRLIQQPAVGYEGIDLEAARARGIPVCNAPGMNTDAVAQAALLLLLAVARRFPRAQRAFARAEIGSPAGVELTGLTLAIVGFGRTGSTLARAAHALGMKIVPVRRGDALLDALRVADAVSLHLPLSAATRGMIGDEAFAAMKPGALLVNVSRGGLIDRGALERALPKLGGVGLDVFWEEPWDPADPLFARDEIVVTPHVAGSTEAAFDRIAAIVAKNVAALHRGEPFVHRIA